MAMNGLIGYTGFVGQNLDGPQYDFALTPRTAESLQGKL